jgi:hypothetical protein
MTRKFLNALACLIVAGAGLAPALAHSRSLDQLFDCKSDAHTFVGALASTKDIDADPMRVETNSVNAFRPEPGSDLKVFGFPVYAVLGYERGDTMFRTGSGTPIAGSLYGVVVSGPMDEVEARMRQAGSYAVVREVLPFVLTAVVCNEGHL